MPRFFVTAGAVQDGHAAISGEDAAHLARSLRATAGEHIVVVDDNGVEHGLRLEHVTAARVEGVVEWSRPATGEPGVEVHVVQAIAKDGMDELVEALSEVGAAAIWPVHTRRTVVRLDERRAEHRVARWNAIARNAAQLAGRGRPPAVHAVRGLDEVMQALPAGTRVLVCSTAAEESLHAAAAQKADRVALVIGPEGGFDDDEIDKLRAQNASLVHLGPRVLRARLAGVVAVATLLASSGELDRPIAGAPAHTEAAAG